MSELKTRRIAVPTHQGQLCMHFGHCEAFTFLDIDTATKEVVSQKTMIPPEHEPGVFPSWMKEQGVHTVIAGGMGSRAQKLLRDHGIEVVVGAQTGNPTSIALDYLNGKLAIGDNVCDH